MHVNINCGLEEPSVAAIVVLDRGVARIVINHLRQFRVPSQIDIEFNRIGGRRTNVVEVNLVRLEIVFQKIVPLENRVLVRMHEAGAGLQIEPRIPLLHCLQLARGIDRDRPRARLLSDLVMLLRQSIYTHRHGDVQIRTLFQNARHIGKDSFLNLTVRH